MSNTDTKSTESAPARIAVVVPARSQDDVVRAAHPGASQREVTAAMCSCVVHLCGCE